MTLEQAQEQFDDALQLTLTHVPNGMTDYRLRKIAECGMSYMEGKPCEVVNKVLFIKVGKTKSRVIFSRKAYLADEKQRNNEPENSK